MLSRPDAVLPVTRPTTMPSPVSWSWMYGSRKISPMTATTLPNSGLR